MAASCGGADETPSYQIDGGNFVKDNVAVLPTGVVMRGRSKAFTVVPDEMELGRVIGRGASSYVQRALHRPTGTHLAIKTVNVFDKSKRHQLLREIQALYDADCIRYVGPGSALSRSHLPASPPSEIFASSVRRFVAALPALNAV